MNAPSPEQVICANCKQVARPGFLCPTCGTLVRMPKPSEPEGKIETPGYDELPEGF